MARALKPQKVDTWRDVKRGVKLDLFLNRNDNTFFFDYQQARTSRPSIRELQQAAHDVVEASVTLVWLPMITVDRLMPFARDDGDEFIGFEVSRNWIARKADGTWLEVNWEHDDTDEDREMWAQQFYLGNHAQNFALPYYGNGNGLRQSVHDIDSFYLPYTEELWVGLEALLGKIRFLKTKLDELLTTPAGLNRLATFAHQLLAGAAFGVKALPGTVEPPSDTPSA
jgi:hypothetical protein